MPYDEVCVARTHVSITRDVRTIPVPSTDSTAILWLCLWGEIVILCGGNEGPRGNVFTNHPKTVQISPHIAPLNHGVASDAGESYGQLGLYI